MTTARNPIQHQIPRANYKATWEELASTYSGALLNVAGTINEERFRRVGQIDVERIRAAVTIHQTDTVLEIGCGVGRLGRVLAQDCARWIGTDVSANMIGFAREYLAGYANVELLVTNGYDLRDIPDASVDVVYCSVVFMHLDEWDRYNYILESRRILRPGGQIYVDNFNLASPGGWSFFELHRRVSPADRATQMSKSSMPQELQIYLEHAAFEDIRLIESGVWISATGLRTECEVEAEPDKTEDGFFTEVVTSENFDEIGYRAANPDIADAVYAGLFPSGRSHFESHGKTEKRLQWHFPDQAEEA